VVIYAEDVTEQRQSAIDQERSVLEERSRLASELHDTISPNALVDKSGCGTVALDMGNRY